MFTYAILAFAVVGGIAGGAAVLVVAFLLPRKSCPKCKTLLPRFRKPSSAREAMLGGMAMPSVRRKSRAGWLALVQWSR
ncbi:hypothetical protein HEP75_04301 [Xanthomonas sp. SI]|nr:hypothetical protein HEP75_04301 [Xanthomonas sp. SI]